MQKGQKDNHRCATSECYRDATHPPHPLNLHSFVLDVPKKTTGQYTRPTTNKEDQEKTSRNFKRDLTAGFYFYT